METAKLEQNPIAWHGQDPYTEEETLRLRRSCEMLREDAEQAAVGRRYDVLDVGCGIGPLRQWLPAARFRITGIDMNPHAVETAKQHYDSCLLLDGEQEWPLPAASLDAVHAGAILEHVINWHGPLNQANRTLRDGGLLVASVPNLCYWKSLKRMLRFKQPHWLTQMKHVHGYTLTFLRELIELHGFEITALEADRVNLPLLRDRPWVLRKCAAIGSVFVLSARLVRRVRVEDRDLAYKFPAHTPVGLRSIEVLSTGEERGTAGADSDHG
jgi:SAM-dependent methyltransferase